MSLLKPLLIVLLVSTPSVLPTGAAVDFNRDVRPILSDHCFQCHGPDADHRKAKLRLDVRPTGGKDVLAPGQTGTSELVARVTAVDPEDRMPPPEAKRPLSSTQIQTLKQWIAEGAPYAAHWAFAPLRAQAIPEGPESGGRNPIDAWVSAFHREQGLKAAPEADRETLIRRVAFDLTGLPPTLEEVDAFLGDQAPGAYERLVDRLLRSQSFGEHLAAGWLDAARYADTFGYQADRDMKVWPWRDWVIRSFNDNLPYDDFLTWQLAGDLLPDPNPDQVVATAFNRLHRQTNEGGSINEEYRVEYVSDRIHTMGTAMLGLTLECARCHDHKYDPILQEEYYELTAFFNRIDESGLYSHFTDAVPTPNYPLYEGDQEARHRELKRERAQAETAYQAELRRAEKRFEKWNAGKETLVVAAPEAAATFDFEDAKPASGYQVVAGKEGQGLRFDGDGGFSCGEAGRFSRTDPFSFAIWARPAENHEHMVVFHWSRSWTDSASRGYELLLEEGRPDFALVHFWPGNAVRVRALKPIPLNEWSHLAVTYDGSSRASGIRLYVNGKAVAGEVIRDHLYQDIQHRKEWGDAEAGKIKLTLAARFRDIGFKDGVLDAFQVYDRQLSGLEVAALGGMQGVVEDGQVKEHYLLTVDPQLAKARSFLRGARVAENEQFARVREIMVMQDQPEPRPTYQLKRGAYDARGKRVHADTPEAILPFPEGAPRNRLGLARWLTHPENPLTARVAVNRFWSNFFGRGLVSTAEDFGSQGQRPMHPELLNWLAHHFMESGWDVKGLCRLIATSATYRQASRAEPDLLRRDPDNDWLARGPSHRLSAEQIRDNALAVSGLLAAKVGGPSVKPYQPAGLWKEKSGKVYVADKGEGLYRRSLYTFWRRTSPPPSMLTFDAVTREVCIARRERTATPLQALVLLNDPQYVEAARVLAAREIQGGEAGEGAGLIRLFRLTTSRSPAAREVAILSRLLQEQREYFAEEPQRAKDFLATGHAAVVSELSPTELAAWSQVALALLNYDECVTKR